MAEARHGLSAAVPYCEECGADRAPSATFCPHCRAPLRALPPAPPTPSVVQAKRSMELWSLEDLASAWMPWPARSPTCASGSVDDCDVLRGHRTERGADIGRDAAIPEAVGESQASLVDDPMTLAGNAGLSSRMVRLQRRASTAGAARIDDVDNLAVVLPGWSTPPPSTAPTPGAAPSAEARQMRAFVSDGPAPTLTGVSPPTALSTLARDWEEAAERPIPRKDHQPRGQDAPARREVFLHATTATQAPAEKPEPTTAYVAAKTRATAGKVPWATLGGVAAQPLASTQATETSGKLPAAPGHANSPEDHERRQE